MDSNCRGDKSAVLVVGGGIAGMQSSLLLAEMGRKVFLLEQGPAIGGYFPLLDKQFPTNSCGVCFMNPRQPAYCPIYECELHERVELLTYCQIQSVEEEDGRFRVSIRRMPRFVDSKKCNFCRACFDVCPVEVENEYFGGFEKRKAIYVPFDQAIPRTPVIDPKTCIRCDRCVDVCPFGAIDLEMKESSESIEAGAIILGFGFEPFWAKKKGEYGFGRYDNVLTSVQFERMLSTSSLSRGIPQRLSDGKPIKRMAFIQCIGSRDPSCGQEHCSTICCMYATKQAVISKQRVPDIGITVFYMDIRPMGKDYERYFEMAKKDYGVSYRRCAISTIKELQRSKNLQITYVDEGGEFVEEEFDAVVLSVGFTPPGNVREVAERLGIALNRHGFCETAEFTPYQTSRKGIFVGGAFRGPRDIPEAVTEGASAAAAAASYLASYRPLISDTGYPLADYQKQDVPRIGVFLCNCGEELREMLAISNIPEIMRTTRDVVHFEEIGIACSAQGAEKIGKSIREQKLNRIVIAGCSKREIAKILEKTAMDAGLNRYTIEYANIREQCAFVHTKEKEMAARKAEVLVRMAVDRARRIQPIVQRRYRLSDSALVVGGGVAGMTAALRLAEQGFRVCLVEKSSELGGNVRNTFFTLRGSDPQFFLRRLIEDVTRHELIDVNMEAEVVSSEKLDGNFRTCIRRAGSEKIFEHSVLILATGGQEIAPRQYRYGEDPRIITQRQLEKTLHSDIKSLEGVKQVVMIQCVGSRDQEHPYCSRVCCGHAVKNALKLKDNFPDLRVYILYRDVRTYGFYEIAYMEARSKGVIFVRYDLDSKPEVTLNGSKLAVSLNDRALDKRISIEADRIVLSTGIEPNENRRLGEIFGVDLNADGFFQEANPKAAPLDSIDRGKFFCGICHSPNYIEDVISQGNAVAARAAALLAKHEVEGKAYAAYVIKRLCSGCGLCVKDCPYGARILNEEEMKAEVVESLCQGCGQCAIVCRNAASEQRNFEKGLNMAVLDTAIE